MTAGIGLPLGRESAFPELVDRQGTAFVVPDGEQDLTVAGQRKEKDWATSLWEEF